MVKKIVVTEVAEELAHEQLAQHVVFSSPRMRLMPVTPDIALEYLSQSDVNRKLHKPRAEYLAQAFRRGEHRLTNDAITFNRYGKMTNGQHRMLGVAIAGLDYPLLFWVMEGAEDDAMMVMDTGRSRSFTDQLRIHQIPNANVIGGATKLLFQYRDGTVADQKRWVGRLAPTVFQLWNFYTENTEEITTATKRIEPARRVLSINSSVLSVAWITLSDFANAAPDADDAAQAFALDAQKDLEGFWDELRMKPGSETSAAVTALEGLLRRQRKLKQRQVGWHTALDARTQLALVFKTWNHYRAGTAPKSGLSFKSGGVSPEAFPTPR
jgi:hypothetical protein